MAICVRPWFQIFTNWFLTLGVGGEIMRQKSKPFLLKKLSLSSNGIASTIPYFFARSW
jgi:hypothetical protein